jgi:hypothetical protein
MPFSTKNANLIVKQTRQHFYWVIWGHETKPHTQYFEFRGLEGTSHTNSDYEQESESFEFVKSGEI